VPHPIALEPTVRAGIRAVLPLAAAIALVELSFGALAATSGLTPAAAVFMSATTFAGSAQFAAVSLFGSGGSVLACALAAALLNARYLAMGAALGPALRGPAWKRLILAQLAVDESWAAAYLGEGRFSLSRMIGAALLLFVVHVAATALGAVAVALGAVAGVSVLGRLDVLGLDAAFPALFLILLWPHLQARAGLEAALLGASVALALVPVAPPGIPVLAAASVSLLGLRGR
jgi:4-azaleucine resistance transporter AzlC